MRTIKTYFTWISEQEELNFSFELLKLLRDNKAKVDIRDVRELLHLGADPNYKILGHSDEEQVDKILKVAQEEEWDLKEVPRVRIYKMATLAYPIFHRNPRVVEVMFEYGADPNLDFSDVSLATGASTAFMYAVRQASPDTPSSMEIVDLFVENGADVNVLDSNGNTLLHTAVERTVFDIIPKLVEIGVATNKKNRAGKLPHELVDTWKEYTIDGRRVKGAYVMDMVKGMLEKS